MKLIAMVSGGIDSPTAAALAKKIAPEIIIVHFCLYPFYCTGSFKLLSEIYKKLYEKFKIKKLILIPWGNVLSATAKLSRKNQCVLCRKSMLKASEMLCKKEDASAIITGEAVGQKASQTLSNMQTASSITIPIIRPLIGMDKEDIIKKSKELGLWMPQHTGCCKIVPDSPATKSRQEEIDFLYKKIKHEVEKSFGKRVEITDKEQNWDTLLKKFI
jgi:thiamine biosynthesis protein ThiI